MMREFKVLRVSPVNRHFWSISQLTWHRREEYQTNRQAAHLRWWICCLAQHRSSLQSRIDDPSTFPPFHALSAWVSQERKKPDPPFQPFPILFPFFITIRLVSLL